LNRKTHKATIVAVKIHIKQIVLL